MALFHYRTVSWLAGMTLLAVAMALGGCGSAGAGNTLSIPNLTSINVTPVNLSIAAGQTQQFTATGTLSDGNTQDLTHAVTWSSLNTSTAMITAGGLATGIAAGSTQIQAKSGSVNGSTMLTVISPTLVQHVSGSSTRHNGFAAPFCYHVQLPNPTTAGNAVIVGFNFNGNPAPSVSDDKNDAFAVEENFFDTTDNQSVAIAAAFNVAAGARTISVCFASDPGGFVQPMATELDNVVGFETGSGNNGTGNLITAGSLTPSESGDLVYQVAASLSGTLSQSTFTAGSQANITWNLLSADLMDGWAGQHGVYLSTSAINPTMSMGTSGTWVSAAILLKAGNAGSVPSGMRIVHLEHENVPFNLPAGGSGNPFSNPLKLQFPSSGNLLVAMIGGGNTSETVTSMADTGLNTWAQAGATQVIAANDTVQAFFAGSAASSSNLGVTLHWTGGQGDFTILLYDVAGASTSPLDATAAVGATGTQATPDGNGTLVMPFTVTPASANEIIFSEVIWDFNTGTGLAGQFFDTNTFSGESVSGPEPVDENNGWGHAVTTTTQPVGFTWTVLSKNLAVGNWAGLAVAFK